MSAVSSSLAAVEPSDATPPPVDSSRHGLFRYLTADESADYLAIMDLFSATLLTDLSAAEVATQLAERGLAIGRDIVEARCRQLVDLGQPGAVGPRREGEHGRRVHPVPVPLPGVQARRARAPGGGRHPARQRRRA